MGMLARAGPGHLNWRLQSFPIPADSEQDRTPSPPPRVHTGTSVIALSQARPPLNLSAALLARARIAVAVALTLGCCNAVAFAQPAPRSLSGTVTDLHHEPLKGAVVQLHDDATNTVVSYITDRNGHYRFLRLSGDNDYHVWAKFRGHKSKARLFSIFDSHPSKVINLVVETY